MIIHPGKQGTPKWDALRAGKITASKGKTLITPTGKISTQWKKEMGRLIAEARGLQPAEFIKPTYWMEQGIRLEPEARGWFQVETGMLLRQCSFIEHDSGLAGMSPDSYVLHEIGDDPTGPAAVIPVEIKCPKPSNHIAWLIDDLPMPNEHLPQCHFQMAIAGAPYMYFMSYNPMVESIIHKIERNSMTEDMEHQIEEFIKTFKVAWERVTGEEYGVA
jgi:hypothetical protein